MTYTTVVVGTDGSDSSYRAVRRAAELAGDVGAELVVISAYQRGRGGQDARAADQLGAEAYQIAGANPVEGMLTEADTIAHQAGAATVTTRAVEGEPVDVLLAAAGADSLLVVGNRGLSTITGRLLGSVPAAITHRVRGDLLIVHTTGR